MGFRLWVVGVLLLVGCARQVEEGFSEPGPLPAVQARVSNESPRVGDVVEVELRVTSDERIVLPPWRELLHSEVRILDQQTPPARVGEDGRWRQDSHLRVGLYSVTNVTLFAEARVTSLSEPPLEVDLPYVALTVEATVADDDAVPNPGNMDLMDLRGSEALRRARRNLLISLAAFLALAAVVGWLIWRNQRRPAPPPPLPKWDQVALHKMKELREAPVWVDADADGSAVALSLILREYIERRFLIHAPELTTEEFLIEASDRQPWDDGDQKELESFFRAVDRIKFAAERPGPDVLEDLMRAAERFVRVTGTNGGAA